MLILSVSILSIAYQGCLVIEHGLNVRCNMQYDRMYTHYYLWHTLLFQCIFASEYSHLFSLLTIRRLIVSNQLWIKYKSCLLCRSIQFSWSAVVPFVKGLSLIYLHNYESSFHQLLLHGEPKCSPALPTQWLLLVYVNYGKCLQKVWQAHPHLNFAWIHLIPWIWNLFQFYHLQYAYCFKNYSYN